MGYRVIDVFAGSQVEAEPALKRDGGADGGYDGVWQRRLRGGMLPLVGVGLGDRNTLAGLAVEYRGVGVCGVEGIGVPAPRSVRLVLDRGCQRLR